MTTKTASQILNDAADLLTEEGRWHQGQFWAFKRSVITPDVKGCSMCAHGAIEYCGSPYFKQTIDAGNHPASYWSVEMRRGEEAMFADKTLSNLASAHYNAFKVGLSFDFNDSSATTKQDVINLLREAAQLSAKQDERSEKADTTQ